MFLVKRLADPKCPSDTVSEPFKTLEAAIQSAEAILAVEGSDIMMTLTVHRLRQCRDAIEPGMLLAVRSNRTIEGTFLKQKPADVRGCDSLYPAGTVTFNATAAVLNLSIEDLRQLKDSDQSSDEIGYSHVAWDGPCEVNLEQDVREFFGVADLWDITSEALADAVAYYKPEPRCRTYLRMTVELDVHCPQGMRVSEVQKYVRFTPHVVAEMEGVISVRMRESSDQAAA